MGVLLSTQKLPRNILLLEEVLVLLPCLRHELDFQSSAGHGSISYDPCNQCTIIGVCPFQPVTGIDTASLLGCITPLPTWWSAYAGFCW